MIAHFLVANSTSPTHTLGMLSDISVSQFGDSLIELLKTLLRYIDDDGISRCTDMYGLRRANHTLINKLLTVLVDMKSLKTFLVDIKSLNTVKVDIKSLKCDNIARILTSSFVRRRKKFSPRGFTRAGYNRMGKTLEEEEEEEEEDEEEVSESTYNNNVNSNMSNNNGSNGSEVTQESAADVADAIKVRL